MTQPPTHHSSPQSFFETWLPARFAEFRKAAGSAQLQLNAECSVYVQIGDAAWQLALQRDVLSVQASKVDKGDESTFRLHMDDVLFERFVLTEASKVKSVPQQLPSSVPALKLLALDDESLALIRDLPGSLKLCVRDKATVRVAVFGPGNRPPEPSACTLTCALDDLEAMKAGRAQPMELFFSGRIQLEGDAQVAMALAGLLL